MVFRFAEPLDERVRALVENYVHTRLDAARPRCQWPDAATLNIVCARSCEREPGIIRLHLQHLAGVTAHGPT
jgi:hypothetical protein